jgi:large subunit ribosomal protein L25
MQRQELKAELREELGKTSVKKIRDKGYVPGVVYKKGASTMNIKLNEKELFKAIHTRAGENILLDLLIDDGKNKSKKKTVIIKEVQRHPIKEKILHVDFNEILLTETIKVNVPIVAKGKPEGVVKDGGTLGYILREIQVECLPTQIPEKIEVKVDGMKIGDSIYVRDLVVASGIKILNDPELTVITIEAPYVEKPPEEAAAEEVTEPEVIKKERKKEEELEEEPEAGEGPSKSKEEKKREDKKEG